MSTPEGRTDDGRRHAPGDVPLDLLSPEETEALPDDDQRLQAEVEECLRLGREHPLSEDESRRLLTRIVEAVAGNNRPGIPTDPAAQAAFVGEMIAARKKRRTARVEERPSDRA